MAWRPPKALKFCIIIQTIQQFLQCGLRAQVIHARLQIILPPIEVHARELSIRQHLEAHDLALALAYERAMICGHVEGLLLRDLPVGLVDYFDLRGDGVDVLHEPLFAMTKLHMSLSHMPRSMSSCRSHGHMTWDLPERMRRV